MIPTGSRDPFALRRAAAGIYKRCIEHKLNLDVDSKVIKADYIFVTHDNTTNINFWSTKTRNKKRCG